MQRMHDVQQTFVYFTSMVFKVLIEGEGTVNTETSGCKACPFGRVFWRFASSIAISFIRTVMTHLRAIFRL